MINGKIRYEFVAAPWQYSSPGGWYFISVPEDVSKEIRENLKWQEEGWGRLKITAGIGSTQWKTSIWFDTKRNTYLLPLKADVRKKEKIESGNDIDVIIWI